MTRLDASDDADVIVTSAAVVVRKPRAWRPLVGVK